MAKPLVTELAEDRTEAAKKARAEQEMGATFLRMVAGLEGFEKFEVVKALTLVVMRLRDASAAHPKPYQNLHQVYGLMQEEVAEFFELVRLKESKRSPEKVASELFDIMTVCLRAILDLDLCQDLQAFLKAMEAPELEDTTHGTEHDAQ